VLSATVHGSREGPPSHAKQRAKLCTIDTSASTTTDNPIMRSDRRWNQKPKQQPRAFSVLTARRSRWFAKHSTWNRTTGLERAYRGGTRPCPRHPQHAGLPCNLHQCAGRWPAPGHGREGLAAGVPRPRCRRITAKGTPLPTDPGHPFRRGSGGPLVQVPLVLRGNGLLSAVVL
jgi:hypothetical protein